MPFCKKNTLVTVVTGQQNNEKTAYGCFTYQSISNCLIWRKSVTLESESPKFDSKIELISPLWHTYMYQLLKFIWNSLKNFNPETIFFFDFVDYFLILRWLNWQGSYFRRINSWLQFSAYQWSFKITSFWF